MLFNVTMYYEMILCFEVMVDSRLNDCPNILIWIEVNIRVLDFDIQQLIKMAFINSVPITRERLIWEWILKKQDKMA
jgi:hypothetical protein